MWLLPIFSGISRLAGGIYYRLTVTGEPVRLQGTALLVANHPNALLDPMLVSAAARRPVRFLAKAPLLEGGLGWLMRGVGAIPVYRRMDDPSQTGRNVEMFQAVIEGLHHGAAVGLFPEGISHNEPSLAPLRTGAARIALGAYARAQEAFPIVPVGLVLRRKAAFRSEALVILGRPVAWDDLGPRGDEDREAVQELTDRIEAGLRVVTLNLERWEDWPVVECAEAIWTAERAGDLDPAAGVARMEAATRILGRLRREEAGSGTDLVRQVEAHGRRLESLGIAPADLDRDLRLGTGVRWAVRRLHLLGLPAGLVGAAGYLLFLPPRWLTERAARIGNPPIVQRATNRLMGGILIYTLWVILLVAVAGVLWGFPAAAAALVLVPAVAILGLWIRERWWDAWEDIRRFFMLRSRRELIGALKDRQQRLAARLEEVYRVSR